MVSRELYLLSCYLKPGRQVFVLMLKDLGDWGILGGNENEILRKHMMGDAFYGDNSKDITGGNLTAL